MAKIMCFSDIEGRKSDILKGLVKDILWGNFHKLHPRGSRFFIS